MAKTLQGGRRPMQHTGSCYRTVPWVALACAVLMVVSIPIWFSYTTSAANSTKQALQAETLQGTDISTAISQTSSRALAAFYIIRTVALVLLLVCVALLVMVGLQDTALRCKHWRTGNSAGIWSLRSFLTFSAAGTVLLWLAMLAVVVLLALSTTWYLGAWAGSSLLAQASQLSSNAEQAAKRAVDSASSMVKQLQTTQLEVMDSAPGDLKNTQWFKDFRKGVQDLDTSILVNSGSAANTTCKPGCISLDLLAGLAGLQSNCICLTNTFTDLQQGLNATKQSMLPALIGLALLYLAASWLLIYCTASYVTARRQVKEQQVVLPVLNGVDASVDIHSGGSGNAKHTAGAGYAAPAGRAGFMSSPAGAGVGAAGADAASAPRLDAGAVQDQFSDHGHSHLFGTQRPVTPEYPTYAAADAPGNAGSNGATWTQLQQQQQQFGGVVRGQL